MQHWLLSLVVCLMVSPSSYAARKCGPEVFGFVPLLAVDDLRAIAQEMQGYVVKPGVIHHWRDSGSGNAFMHARENPMAHWLATRLILERLRDIAKASGWDVQQQLQAGMALPFFDRAFEDIVNGDPHFGNIGSIPLVGPQNWRQDVSDVRLYRYQMHLVFNDVDDAGHGPLMGDFLRNAATSALAGVDVAGIAKAYVDGLGHKPLVAPQWTEKILSLSMAEFEDLQVQKMLKMYRDGQFYKKGGEISYDVPEPLVHTISLLFPDTVLDLQTERRVIASFKKEGGGSGGINRYWALRCLLDGKRIVSELKWITDRPGVMGYNPDQPDPGARFDIGIAQMWHARNHEVYRVSLDGRDFMVRPRYENLIKKRVEKCLKNREDLTEWANFSAELLGENHDMSPRRANVNLLKFITKNSDAYNHATHQMVHMINAIFDLARSQYGVKAP